MSGAVRRLSLADPDTLRALVALQRASYRVEADLAGADDIPALRETPETLADSGETFLGIDGDGGALLGAVAYLREGDRVEIHRLVVDPAAFRRGLGTRLLEAVEQREAGVERWQVITTAANAPARALYEGRGFAAAGELTTAQGVRLVRYAR